MFDSIEPWFHVQLLFVYQLTIWSVFISWIFCYCFSGSFSLSGAHLQQAFAQKTISGIRRRSPKAKPIIATRFWMLLGKFNRNRIFLMIIWKKTSETWNGIPLIRRGFKSQTIVYLEILAPSCMDYELSLGPPFKLAMFAHITYF